MMVATVCLMLVLAAAFVAADATRSTAIFSLSPPPPKHEPARVMPPDVTEANRLDLHRTFFAAWAALLLATPALCLFPFRRSSPAAAGYWLAFWTAAFLAFAVHFYWAVFVIFRGNWETISHSTRVSAPVVDTVFVVWWALDVLLAWTIRAENGVIRVERTIVHLLAAALFILGSAKEGEIWLSKALGFAMAGAIVIALLVKVTTRRRIAVAPSS